MLSPLPETRTLAINDQNLRFLLPYLFTLAMIAREQQTQEMEKGGDWNPEPCPRATISLTSGLVGRFSKVPKRFIRTRRVIAKPQTLWLQSCFIHIYLLWTEVLFTQEVSETFESFFRLGRRREGAKARISLIFWVFFNNFILLWIPQAVFALVLRPQWKNYPVNLYPTHTN